MIVISNGMPKTASSYIFQLTTKIAKQSLGKVYDLNRLFEDKSGPFIGKPEDLVVAINKLLGLDIDWTLNHIVIKTHCQLTDELCTLLNRQEVKATLTYRDLAEVALSLRDVAQKEKIQGKERFNWDLADIEGQVMEGALKSSSKNVLDWIRNQNVISIFYDNIINSGDLIRNQIAEALALTNIDNTLEIKNTDTWEFNKGIINRAEQELSKTTINLLHSYNKEYSDLVT